MFLVALLSSLVFPAAAAESNGVMSDRVLIGLSTVTTGRTAINAGKVRAGASIVIDAVNAKGGVHGRKIKIIFYDDAYEPAVAITNVKKLIVEDKVFCLFQNYGAESTLATLPLLEKHDVPLVAPIASPESLRVPTRKNVFTVRASSALEMNALVRMVAGKLGLSQIAIISQRDAHGEGMRQGVLSTLHDLNLKAVFDGQFPRNSDDVDPILEGLIASKAKAVILGAQTKPSLALVKKAAAKGFKPVYLGHNLHTTPEFLQELGADAPKLYFAQSLPVAHDASAVPLVKIFLKECRAAGLEVDGVIFDGYVNALVLVEGLKRAGPSLTRDSFRTALETMKDFDLGGVHLHYSPESHRGLQEIFLGTIKEGKPVPVD